jgi:hypothetical protein
MFFSGKTNLPRRDDKTVALSYLKDMAFNSHFGRHS